MSIELDEIKKREKGLRIINSKIKTEGIDSIVDLTGLAGGFDVTPKDISLLETYAGPAVFDEKIQKLGIEHMGGEKVLPLNRTTSGIAAMIITYVKEGDEIVHFLPKKPGHPSIPRTANLVGADYVEYSSIDDFKISDNTALVVITGTTMDHEVITEDDFKQIIQKAKDKD
ncbi:MAG TPA: TIGR03576 family pyridoxal phosphate-dependent enzyme, partial [Methanosphaera sp.]|nr:TIGR03576 family pyridoxal phosphate-dependent enzyme [Methanosphaera sp.]